MNCRAPVGASAASFLPRLSRWHALLAGLGLLAAGPLPAAAAASGATPAPRAAGTALPAFFEANRGQADARYAFVARGQRHAVQLAANEAVVVLEEAASGTSREVRLAWVGASPAARPEGLEPLAGRVHYLLGSDPSRWQTGVPTFGRVRFEGILPGIDVVYYANGRELEYDFLLAPGADPRALRLRVEGADQARMGRGGELILEAGGVRLLQHRPVAYQVVQGARRPVAVRYVLAGREVTLAVGDYDPALPLVIDPILSYSTYLGSAGQQQGWAIAVDASGAVYVAGETLTALKTLPVSGLQTNFAGGTSTSGDAFVGKLTPDGTAFAYLTYLGGSSLDGAVGLAVDAEGHAFVTGYTTSREFPVTPGAYQTTIAGRNVQRTTIPPSDAFVAKLSPDGGSLVYATFLGGTNLEGGVSIAVDAAGSAHVAGYTETEAVYRQTNRICITTCTNDLCGPTSCTTNVVRGGFYLQPSLTTNLTGTQVTANPPGTNTTYQIVETTPLSLEVLDAGFPVTNAAQQFHGGDRDLFVARLSPSGSALLYSTYLGGSERETPGGLALDAAGNVYVTGGTSSDDLPVSTNAFQPFRGDNRDAFVTSLDPVGAIRYSTYLGGSGLDRAYGIAVDAAGAAVVTGSKTSADFPTTPGAWNRGGVYRSLTGGDAWLPSGDGLAHTVVEALAALPDGGLLAATPRGVFRGAPGGLAWTPAYLSLSLGGFSALATDATGTNLYVGTGEGLLLSPDAGANWYLAEGFGDRRVSAVALAGGVILAGTRGAGVYRSTNQAVSWKAANSGLGNLAVNALAVHPADASLVFAATDGGVFRSTNSGATWRGANGGLTPKIILSLALDPATPGTLYAGTGRGVYKSLNHGSNWTFSGTGLTASNILALTLDPQSPSIVYAGSTNGLFKSLDGAATWSNVSTGLFPREVRSLAWGTLAPAALYAGLRASNSFGGSNDVFLTKLLPDGTGLEWSVALGGRRDDQAFAVALDGVGRPTLAGWSDSTNFPTLNTNGFLRATNAGKRDVFVARFSSDASQLLYSAYLGGKAHDYGHGLAVDGAGAAYVTGRTDSKDFPVVSAFQPGFGGTADAFVAKVIPEVAVVVMRTPEAVQVRWPGPLPGYALEGAESPAGPWTVLPAVPTLRGGTHEVSLPHGTRSQFFRLRRATPAE
ncbi:MAG: hypothetical protein RJA22_83 [Verrucomicrobiota bacterium]